MLSVSTSQLGPRRNTAIPTKHHDQRFLLATLQTQPTQHASSALNFAHQAEL